jgi:transcriptional regulator with XRE-family HTH domain
MSGVGTRIKEMRKQRGMTQQELADASGMPRYKIGKIETDDRGVDATEMAFIADALGVAPSAIVRSSGSGVLFRNGAPRDPASIEAVRWFEEYVKNSRTVRLLKRSMPDAAAH